VAGIRLEQVSKIFPDGTRALDALDLRVRDGELLVLVGPSGCGKSTALRCVAGLETVSAGRILLGEREVTGLPPRERDVAMVFQSYALYPHKTVRRNLAFPLEVARRDWAEIARRVEEAARRLGLEALLDRKPGALSGGQRQRVALGRALVREPAAFLLDEPLSNLDAGLRERTRAELALLHRRLGATMLYVTHDQEEAMTLGERIAVLREGRLHQVAPPLEIYRRPADLFVARFIGSPAMNLLPAPLARRLGASQGIRLGVRPQVLELVEPGQGDADIRVEVVEPLGDELRVHARLESQPDDPDALLTVCVSARDGGEPPVPDRRLGLRVPREALHAFDAATGRRRGGGAQSPPGGMEPVGRSGRSSA